MERTVKDKTAVITGGSRNIGYEIADSFLTNGAKLVILLDVDEKEGNLAVTTLTNKHGKKAVFIKTDVTKDLDAVTKNIIDTYKKVDILVNNAGIINEIEWRKCVDVNLIAVIDWSRKFWEHMRKDKGGAGGTIMNVASLYGFTAERFISVYHATKFAVLGYTRSLGHEFNFQKSGVRVVALCPGFTDTVLLKDMKVKEKDFFGDTLDKYLKTVVMQDVAVVGNAATSVIEKGNSGSCWLIDGGKLTELSF